MAHQTISTVLMLPDVAKKERRRRPNNRLMPSVGCSELKVLSMSTTIWARHPRIKAKRLQRLMLLRLLLKRLPKMTRSLQTQLSRNQHRILKLLPRRRQSRRLQKRQRSTRRSLKLSPRQRKGRSEESPSL